MQYQYLKPPGDHLIAPIPDYTRTKWVILKVKSILEIDKYIETCSGLTAAVPHSDWCVPSNCKTYDSPGPVQKCNLNKWEIWFATEHLIIIVHRLTIIDTMSSTLSSISLQSWLSLQSPDLSLTDSSCAAHTVTLLNFHFPRAPIFLSDLIGNVLPQSPSSCSRPRPGPKFLSGDAPLGFKALPWI